VPPELASGGAAAGDGVAHGFEGTRRPELADIQAVLDRLAPEPTTARNLRWSSVSRISHRIVDSYGRGRVFVAGDAAGLLSSYDAERRTVGEEVVGRTVRSARAGIGADSDDPDYVVRREAQLLISYADSPIVGVGAGGRAPDARGLIRSAITDPIRLFTLFGREHTLLLHAGDAVTVDAVAGLEATADAAVPAVHRALDVY
jgi:FAD binding domain